MNKFESRPLQSKSDVADGWVVQVYSSQRRLLCVLEPSHGWVFLIGCGVGLLLAAIWFALAGDQPHSPRPNAASSVELPAAPAAKSPALQVD